MAVLIKAGAASSVEMLVRGLCRPGHGQDGTCQAVSAVAWERSCGRTRRPDSAGSARSFRGIFTCGRPVVISSDRGGGACQTIGVSAVTEAAAPALGAVEPGLLRPGQGFVLHVV